MVKYIMIGAVGAFLIAPVISAAPATQPTTRPTTQPTADLSPLLQKVDQAAALLQTAKTAAAARADSSPESKTVAIELAAKEQALERARATGSAQQKLDASAAASKLRQKAVQLRAEYIANDSGVRVAELALFEARSVLAQAQAGERHRIENEQRDAADRSLHPVQWYLSHHQVAPEVAKAVSEGRWIHGMDAEQQMLVNDGPGKYLVTFKRHWHSGGFAAPVGRNDVVGDPILDAQKPPEVEVQAKSRAEAAEAAQQKYNADIWIVDKAVLRQPHD